MSADMVIEKYATALFEVALASGKAAEIANELEAVSKAFGDKASVDFFRSPFNSKDSKVAAAKSSLEGKVSTEVFNFIATLAQNERMHLIAEMNILFKSKAARVGGDAEGTLFVVTEPSAEFKTALEAKVSAVLKRKVKLKTQIDKALVSGFKVQVEGWTLDDSAAFHLKKLTEDISKRGL